MTAKALIDPWEGSVAQTGGLDLRHVLIRQAAYRSLTHGARAELHERLATWLHSDARPAEVDELAGHHFEQAF